MIPVVTFSDLVGVFAWGFGTGVATVIAVCYWLSVREARKKKEGKSDG